MAQEIPYEFHMKDLFIDVKLEACANGTTFDYLGKKLFSTEFYRENIGFGITDINIEVNTSLQPLVTITFKDLYGNTIFGTQNKDAAEDGQSIDYSSIFNWPPPKFLFSFKGYLGRATTWVLNLKRTSTSFNSSDGSYDLKCEFVPNQWGFFADLPFLYLLAAKRLRKDKLGDKPTPQQLESITSVFDLLKIGKQVEVKTQDTTKEFDDLVKQLGSIKSNMARAMVVSNILEDGEVIDGVVNNRAIVNFQKMELPKLASLDDALNNPEKIEQKLGSPTELTKLNTYLILSIKFGGSDGWTTFNVAKPAYADFSATASEIQSAKNQQIEFVTKNLDKIDDEIKRVVFSTSESKLEKITIGEIFSQTAKDAAFIIGSIIDSGLEGYRGSESRQGDRDLLVKEGILIGESFPLMINPEGEEVPATKENLSKVGKGSIEVDEYEMDFVRRFTNAISEGIARDLIKDGNVPGQDDGKLLQRINNMEMTSGNPYKAFYSNIASNIFIRGGIVSHMTRSSDPNIPGDYHGFWGIDGDGRGAIQDIAGRDASNITDTILTSLSDTDARLLQRFCDFITRFYGEDGETLVKFNAEGEKEEGDDVTSSSDSYPVLMSSDPNITLDFKQIWKELRKPSLLDGAAFDENGEVQYENDHVDDSETNAVQKPEKNLGFNTDAANPLSFVTDDYKAIRIINNGLAYTFTGLDGIRSLNKYWGVLFRGTDNQKAQEATNAPSDQEYKGEDKDNTDFVGQNSPLGYIPINQINGEDGQLDRVDTLYEWRTSQTMLDYSVCKKPSREFFSGVPPTGENAPGTANGLPGLQQFLWINELAEDNFQKSIKEKSNPKPVGVDVAGQVGYTVCYHQSSSNILVFDFFGSTDEAINHRVYVRAICSIIKDNLSKIEDERNQVIGSVLGKAGDGEASLYKQMHTLFQQWQSLSYSDKRGPGGGLCGNDDEFKDAGKFNVAESLEEKFGTRHYNLLGNSVEVDTGTNQGNYNITNEEQNKSIDDGTFVYDYPLQRITGVKDDPVKVRDSIINLEPMYKINGNTTVLNIIQQICTKNNFLFVPIPGNPGYLDVKSIYSPSSAPAYIDVKNFFHVLFTPTPESRTKTSNKGDALALSSNHEEYDTNSFVIKYGDPSNQIVSDIQVGTDDNKVTAESIVNLQRLVDNENQNKKVTTDCSMLPVLAGRSYKASIKMLGNAQVYPMQFFFLKNSPLFGGLYQIMKVSHTITPNDFKTSADGIRMRFSPSAGYGGIRPITLDTFRSLGELNAPLATGGGIDNAAAKTEINAAESSEKNKVNGTPGTSNGSVDASGVPASIDQCPNVKNVLNEPIVRSTKVKNAYGSFIQGKKSFIAKLEKAFTSLEAEGYVFGPGQDGKSNGPVGDSYRSFETQRAGHLNILEARKNWEAGKPWTKNGITYPASKKPPWVAHPCKGYHVQGQAIDLNQGAYYTKGGDKTTFKDDITSHGPLYAALYDAGVRRISNEWWHWSVGEASHEKNQMFKANGVSPADKKNFKKYN